MNVRKLRDWRKVLIYSHRWLGIAFGLLFLVWFVSGVAFMYWGMPVLSEEERLDHQLPVDLSTASLSPVRAARRHLIPASSLTISMKGDRPVYRFGGAEVYADTGEFVDVEPADAAEAVRIVQAWVPEHASSVRHDALLSDSDQWTLQTAQRRHMPLHRISVGDPAGTYYYVASRTGQIVMKTDRPSRIKGFLSGVLHWVYFTPLRQNTELWIQFIIWGSFAGGFMCLLGLAAGIWRLSPRGVYRQKRQRSHSPYAGMMRWHHYAGLLFGVVTFTWVLSGAFSVEPFDMFADGPGLGREDRALVTGGAFDIEGVTHEDLRAGLAVMASHFSPKEIEVRQFRGRPYMTADRPPGTRHEPAGPAGSYQPRHQMVWLDDPASGAFTAFDHGEIESIADAMMPGVPVQDRMWLDQYDNYYRSRDGSRPLPVLRIRYLNEGRTWAYLDPAHGTVTSQGSGARSRRWLYAALHEFDFPLLYESRPLWDIVVIVLSIGGVVLSGTTLWPTAKRLYRHGRRLKNLGRRGGGGSSGEDAKPNSRRCARVRANKTSPAARQVLARLVEASADDDVVNLGELGFGRLDADFLENGHECLAKRIEIVFRVPHVEHGYLVAFQKAAW